MLRRLLISIIALLASVGGFAQSRVAADVEVKTLMDGKVTTVTKRVFCQGNGRLVTVFSPAGNVVISNLNGEMTMYSPATNEVFTSTKTDFSTKNDLLYLFLSGRSSDLGLASYGYRLDSSEYEEGGYLKRTYKSDKKGKVPTVELVLKDYLPVYVAYIDASRKVVSKTYLSGYDTGAAFVFPSRVTGIDYLKSRDSTVTRTIYSNVRTDSSDKEFNFEIPADAVSVKSPF